jgi:hypothetical protein
LSTAQDLQDNLDTLLSLTNSFLVRGRIVQMRGLVVFADVCMMMLA